MRSRSQQLDDVLSDDEDDNRQIATDESVYLNTIDLTKTLEVEKMKVSKTNKINNNKLDSG